MSDETPKTAAHTTTEDELRAATIGELQPLDGKILLVAYDPDWPRQFAAEASKIQAALGERVLLLEHVGSTSVPGLAAKPILDILLVVADSSDDAAYVPALEQAGYTLRIREPAWFEHRVLKGVDPAVHLHVFSPDCEQTERMLLFRNWLRAHDDDRDLYARTKRELAQRDWKYMQNYADAKTDVVEAILARARAAEVSGRP
ncbi:MAG TPA: GrpB family protein [Ktedonobacterales bacterium]|nr:GrpB family protein [Ktedonobacterales bacterium]